MNTVISCGVTDAPQIKEGFLALLDGSAVALRIAQVLTTTEAKLIARKLRCTDSLESYAHLDGIAKLGQALAEVRSELDFRAYLACAKTISNAFESMFGFDPAQRIKDVLSTHWSGGARPVELKGLAFPDRILRQQVAGWSGEHAHVDFPPDLVRRSFAGDDWKQLGSVLYAEVPEEGGELQIWTQKPLSLADWETIQRVGRYGLSLRELGEPAVQLAIGTGEIIFFPTHYPHTVAPIVRGTRTSFGAFALIGNPNLPVRLWS